MASGRAKKALRPKHHRINRLSKNAHNSSSTTQSASERAHQDLKDAVGYFGPVAISEGTIDEMKEILVQHRQTLDTIPTAKFNESAAIRDIVRLLNGEINFYSRLDGPTFAIVLQLLLVNEDSRDTERGAFLAASSLYENAHRDSSIKLKTIGRMLDILVKHFADITQNVHARRWLGLLLLEAHEQCEENHAKFQDLTENVRRKLGSMITDEKDEILKIICGKIISVMNSAGCPLQHLWPTGMEKKVYDEFPTEVHDEDWSIKFQGYLDKIDDLTVPSTGHVYWAQDIKTDPKIIDGHTGQIFIFVDGASIFIHIFCEDHFDKEFEIPIQSIDTAALQQTSLDAQPSLQIDDLVISLARGMCYFNATLVNLEGIRIAMIVEAAELMNDVNYLVNLRKDQERSSNEECVISSSNNSYKISQPESPVAPLTGFPANTTAADSNKAQQCQPIDSAVLDFENPAGSNILDGTLYTAVSPSVLVRHDSVQGIPTNTESGNFSESTLAATTLSQAKNTPLQATIPVSLKTVKPPAISIVGMEMTAVHKIPMPPPIEAPNIEGASLTPRKTVTLEIERTGFSTKSHLKQMPYEYSTFIRLSRSGALSSKPRPEDNSKSATKPTMEPLQSTSFKESGSSVNVDHSNTTKAKPRLKTKKPLEFRKNSAITAPAQEPEKSTKFQSKDNIKIPKKMAAPSLALRDPRNRENKAQQKPPNSTANKKSALPRPKKITRQTKELQVTAASSKPSVGNIKSGVGKPKIWKDDELILGESSSVGEFAKAERDFDLGRQDVIGNPPDPVEGGVTRQRTEFGTGLWKILSGHFSDEGKPAQKVLIRDDHIVKLNQEGTYSGKLHEDRLKSATPGSSSSVSTDSCVSKNSCPAISNADVVQDVPEQREELKGTPVESPFRQNISRDELPLQLPDEVVGDVGICDKNSLYLHPAQRISSPPSGILRSKLVAFSEQQTQSPDANSVKKRKAAEYVQKRTPKRVRHQESRSEQKIQQVASFRRVRRQQPKTPEVLMEQIPQLSERVKEASTSLLSAVEKAPILIHDHLIRKPVLIGFDLKGARNQGGSSTSKISQSMLKVHKGQDSAIRPKNWTDNNINTVESADEKVYDDSPLGCLKGSTDRSKQLMAPPVGLHYVTNCLQNQDSKSHSGPRLRFQRPSGSQGSRVTETGSPLPLNSVVAGQHPSLQMIKRGCLMNDVDANEPSSEDEAIPMPFGEKEMLLLTDCVVQSPKNRPESLSTNTKPRQLSQHDNQELNSRYIGCKNARHEKRVGTMTEKIRISSPQLKNSFVRKEPRGIFKEFTKRLKIERVTDERAHTTSTRAPPVRRSIPLSVEDPEKTLVGDENEYDAREQSSASDMTSCSSVTSLNHTPDPELENTATQTAEQIWWAAIRPYYAGVTDSLYQISNHIVLHLQTGHVAAQQIIDDYDDGGIRLIEEVEQHHLKGRAECRHGFEGTKMELKAIYKKRLEHTNRSQDRSVIKFEQDWERQQEVIERDIEEGKRFTFDS